MTRLKIVPDNEPNADGEWIECPVEVPPHTRWRHMEMLVRQAIPAGHHVVAIEPGSRTRASENTEVVPLRRA